jgi:hypothetical protein
MRKIVVGFSRPRKTKLLSTIIMAVEQTNYSHVYVRLYSATYDRVMIYQASGLQVNFVGLTHFLEHNQIVDEFEFEITEEAYKKMMQFAIDQAGVAYGMKQLIGMAIRKFGRWSGLGFKNPWADGHATYVCSELAAHIIKDYISGAIGTDLDDMDPSAVHEHLSQIKRSIRPIG